MEKKQVTFCIESGFIKILKFLVVKQDRSLTNLNPWNYSERSQKLQERRGKTNEIFHRHFL